MIRHFFAGWLLVSTLQAHAQTIPPALLLQNTVKTSPHPVYGAGVAPRQPKKTDKSQLTPEQQFMSDVLKNSVEDKNTRSSFPKRQGGLNQSARDSNVRQAPGASQTAQQSTRDGALQNEGVLEAGAPPASAFDHLTFGDAQDTGFEIGVELKKNFGTHNLTVTPYYKRTPKAESSSLKEYYGAENSDQELGVQIRSVF